MPPVETTPTNDLPAAQRQALESWAMRAQAAGWLSATACNDLQEHHLASPSQLFDSSDRPLVAGLFGGTGVGKSTLLNRLAGEAVARTSAERPTSREATVYVHHRQRIERLPDALPMQHIRTAQHANDRYQQVMFIDMPDFDSVESANRELVDIWLPHLDVVLYVVNPDRYRDDQGWRLLLQHAAEHAWLFIMNHWDRGEPEQLEDFRQQLAGAGLRRPLIFRCDCSPHVTNPTARNDDFTTLSQTLTDLSDEAIIRSLNEQGILARLKSLKSLSDRWLDALGNDDEIERLQSDWLRHWQRAADDLERYWIPRAQRLATQHAQNRARLFGFLHERAAQADTGNAALLIDDAMMQRLDTVLVDFLNEQSHQSHLAPTALKQALTHAYTRVCGEIETRVADALSQSLALPGSLWQRRLHRLLGTLCLLLPLSAMAWIGWRVLSGFIQGGQDPEAYLGINFAINGALLLGLAWLMPTFAQRKLAPSSESAAMRGLKQGMNEALAQVSVTVSESIQRLQEQSCALREQYFSLWQSLPQPTSRELPETVRRMLAEKIDQPTRRSLDVRANTQSSTSNTPVS